MILTNWISQLKTDKYRKRLLRREILKYIFVFAEEEA